MVWQVAAGVMIAAVPIGIVAMGLGVVGEMARDRESTAPGFVLMGIGIAIAAGIIWYGLQH